MGLGQALSIASSGLRATNRELEITASNITNANTPGYTRKVSNREDVTVNGTVTAVIGTTVQRTIDEVAQKQLWTETAASNYTSVMADYLGQVDATMGQPGGPNALDTLLNAFSSALQTLQTSPDDAASRLDVLNDAAILAQKINQSADKVQSLRQDSEFAIESAIDDMNQLLRDIQDIDGRIQEMTLNHIEPVGMMDQRDALISQLSELVPLRVDDAPNNSVHISLENGISIYDQTASQFEFDAYGTISAETKRDGGSGQGLLGKISLVSQGGTHHDLTDTGGFEGGKIGALLELRDEILVETQNQLDSLADGLADAFAKYDVEGTAVTVGAQDGFDVDLSNLQSGDEFTLTYQDVSTGKTNVVTFVRVDSSTSLPLGDDVTARGDDSVVGIDFSGGMASVASQIQAALGGSFTVSNPSGSNIQILDDGAANTVDLTALDARMTATGLQDQAGALPFFVDGGAGPGLYTGSVDGMTQQTGFASRIQINADLMADPSLLVKYSAGVGDSDQTRPDALYDALGNTELQFNLKDGGAPVTMSVDEYAREVIAYQAQQSSTAQTRNEGQKIVMSNVMARYEEGSKVDIDTELAHLLELQTAYTANARVMTAVKEMMDSLMNI